jgi:preprotein translocase subunit SecG
MKIVLAILIVLEVVSSFLLISVILLQKSKGGGLTGSAFGGGGDSMFGARAGNVLTKITIILAVFFMADTMLIAFHFAGQEGKDPSVMEGGIGAPIEIRDAVSEVPVPPGDGSLDGVEPVPLDLPPTDLLAPLPVDDAVVVPPETVSDAPPALPEEAATEPVE